MENNFKCAWFSIKKKKKVGWKLNKVPPTWENEVNICSFHAGGLIQSEAKISLDFSLQG